MTHPKLGPGTVIFDKPHCLQVDFILYGKWNFSQEEWASGKVAPERLRGVHSLAGSAQSDLEYELERAVENGDISEQEALRLLEKNVHPLEVRKMRTPDLNSAYAEFKAHPDDKRSEDLFYTKLLQYITVIVKKWSHDGATFSNIEDAISTSAMKVWRSLEKFDDKRSSFARFVTVITLSEIHRFLDTYKTGHVSLEAAEILPTTELPAPPLSMDKQLCLKEFVQLLAKEDRVIIQMTIDGLTQEEIAEALGVSHQAVSKRLIKLRMVAKIPF